MINLFRRIDRCSRPSGIIAVLIGVYISSDLKTFYFSKPSDFVEAFILPADLAVITKLKETEVESDVEGMV